MSKVIEVANYEVVDPTDLQLFEKDGTTKIGTLFDAIKPTCTEVRNGLFEIAFEYSIASPYADKLENGNIVIANANDKLRNQKFRIFTNKKLMKNRRLVMAWHISFDLVDDDVKDLIINGGSCEYALNELFRQSNFSKHYVGHSDIVNAQDFSMSMCNVLEAIGGKEGSILDTYGNGAELLRDNTNIHVLARRGHDNGVTIEYAKNLTDFELVEDDSALITRIVPYAKYRAEGSDEETIIKAPYVDSPLINRYSHPRIKHIDYTSKFEQGESITEAKLIAFANKEYEINKVDLTKQSFKIGFIPLSKCVGEENINDKIGLCDIVTVRDTRYDVDTKVKVIKVVFDIHKDRYESIELGEPRTSLGDVVGGVGGGNITEETIKDIVTSTPSTNFPNTVPNTPTLTGELYGFSDIALSWTFEYKPYYSYEVYASKTQGFTPNNFDMVFQGKGSTYTFNAKPSETWYFKVCGINSYGRRTAFSNEVSITTVKIDNLENYVESMAIGTALVNVVNAGHVQANSINANILKIKGNFMVENGNGVRTIDVTSAGEIELRPSVFKLLIQGVEKDVATEDYTNKKVEDAKTLLNNNISDVQTSVNDLRGYTDGAFKDGVLTKAEKEKIEGGLRPLKSEFEEVKKEYFVVYSNVDLVGDRATDLNAKYVAYETVTNELISTINTFIQQNTIGDMERAILNGAYTSHDEKLALYKESVNKAIDSIAQKKKQDSINTSKTYTDTEITAVDGKINLKVDQTVYDDNNIAVTNKFAEMTATVDGFKFQVENSGGYNRVFNSRVGESSNAYGFGWRTVDSKGLIAGKKYTLTVSGRVNSSQEGKYLNVFIYNESWSFAASVAIYANVDTINSITFVAPSTNLPIRIGSYHFPNGGNREGSCHVNWYCITEGELPQKAWIPHHSEIYEGITEIDREGVKVTHELGSFTRMSSKEFYQAQEDGARALSVRNGGVRLYGFDVGDVQNDKFIGGIHSTRTVNTANVFGVNVCGTANSKYVSIGFSNSTDDGNFTVTPIINVVREAYGSTPKGINIHDETNFNYKTHFKANPHVYHAQYFADAGTFSEEPHTLWGSNRSYIIRATDKLMLAINYGATKSGIILQEDGSASNKVKVFSYAPWDFGNQNMYNMYHVSHKTAQSPQLRSRTKDINEVYGTFTTDNREIRIKGKNEATMLDIANNEYHCIVELPQFLAENIQADYQVHISKYGFGDYYIRERSPYYFEIVSDREFNFDWEVVATEIEKATTFSIIANDSVTQVEEPSEVIPTQSDAMSPVSKFAFMDDEEIEKAVIVEELKRRNELYKLYKKEGV